MVLRLYLFAKGLKLLVNACFSFKRLCAPCPLKYLREAKSSLYGFLSVMFPHGSIVVTWQLQLVLSQLVFVCNFMVISTSSGSDSSNKMSGVLKLSTLTEVTFTFNIERWPGRTVYELFCHNLLRVSSFCDLGIAAILHISSRNSLCPHWRDTAASGVSPTTA